MSSQQHQQKCKLSANCPPKCPQQGPQAPTSCLPLSAPPAPACCVSTCYISGLGSSCSLISHRFPRFYLRQPQRSECPEKEAAECLSCCHNPGNCS
uniref:RIKEN cDNA 2210017I01 gene n=1 Tax=Mus spicilegus TaxID=10103 RepID=A0A8C6H2D1_MUSSI